jgi:hypothetical protein
MEYNVMFWHRFTLWNDFIKLSNPHWLTQEFFIMRTFKIDSFSNFETYNMLLLIVVSVLHNVYP